MPVPKRRPVCRQPAGSFSGPAVGAQPSRGSAVAYGRLRPGRRSAVGVSAGGRQGGAPDRLQTAILAVILESEAPAGGATWSATGYGREPRQLRRPGRRSRYGSRILEASVAIWCWALLVATLAAPAAGQATGSGAAREPGRVRRRE